MIPAGSEMLLGAALSVAAEVGAGGDSQVVQSKAILFATLLWAGAFVICLG